MDFIEAVKILEKDCYSEMHKQGDFHKRLHLVNDQIEYVEEQLSYDGSEIKYIPTSNDMLVEDWVVVRSKMVNGININNLKDKTITDIKYESECFILTLSDGRIYEFLGDSHECVAWVVIKEITGK